VLPESSIIFEDDEQIVLRVTVTDLERNITHAAEATVRKRVERRQLRGGQRAISQRVTTQGEVVYLVEATDDEVANLHASRVSKLLRNLGLRILPRDVVEEAQDLCVSTLRNRAQQDPAGERRRLVDAFAALGVLPADLARYLGHPLEQLQAAELTELREVFAAVRDGEIKWTDVMSARLAGAPDVGEPAQAAATGGVAAAKERLAAQRTTARKRAAVTTPDPGPDQAEQQAIAIRESLEHAVEHPEWMPGIKTRIEALQSGDDRTALALLFAQAERAIAGAGGAA